MRPCSACEKEVPFGKTICHHCGAKLPVDDVLHRALTGEGTASNALEQGPFLTGSPMGDRVVGILCGVFGPMLGIWAIRFVANALPMFGFGLGIVIALALLAVAQQLRELYPLFVRCFFITISIVFGISVLLLVFASTLITNAVLHGRL